jgi:hypothetical protein
LVGEAEVTGPAQARRNWIFQALRAVPGARRPGRRPLRAAYSMITKEKRVHGAAVNLVVVVRFGA